MKLDAVLYFSVQPQERHEIIFQRLSLQRRLECGSAHCQIDEAGQQENLVHWVVPHQN